jgi:hypothetical protein
MADLHTKRCGFVQVTETEASGGNLHWATGDAFRGRLWTLVNEVAQSGDEQKVTGAEGHGRMPVHLDGGVAFQDGAEEGFAGSLAMNSPLTGAFDQLGGVRGWLEKGYDFSEWVWLQVWR